MKYKSIFISDVHIGNKFSQAEILIKILKEYKSENIFLVWDIIDGWALKRKIRWHESYSKVIQELFKKAKKWTKIYIITWNHDEFLREFTPFKLLENIEFVDEFSYTWINGKKYLIIHWDFFDGFIASTSWIPKIWAFLYNILLNINFMLNKLVKILRIKKRITFSKYVKNKVKKSVNFITNFENILAKYAQDGWYDGVICWHIHKAEIKNIENIEYLNCGDFVESCTAILEKYNWEFSIYDYFKK